MMQLAARVFTWPCHDPRLLLPSLTLRTRQAVKPHSPGHSCILHSCSKNSIKGRYRSCPGLFARLCHSCQQQPASNHLRSITVSGPCPVSDLSTAISLNPAKLSPPHSLPAELNANGSALLTPELSIAIQCHACNAMQFHAMQCHAFTTARNGSALSTLLLTNGNTFQMTMVFIGRTSKADE